MSVEMKCEYPDCPEVKKGKDMAECIDQMKFHINGKHAKAEVPAATFTLKTEEREKKTERTKFKPPVFTEQEMRDEFWRKKTGV